MQYLKEVFKWDSKNGLDYFHLTDCIILKESEEKSYYEDDSLICITKLNEDEIQNTRKRKSKE